jgi:hypothetical protein
MRREFVAVLAKNECTFHLVLAVASVENLVNRNRDAAFAILDLGLERYGREASFVEGALTQVMKMKGPVYKLLDDAKSVIPPGKLLELYRMVHPYLLYSRVGADEEDADEKRRELASTLQMVENAIIRLDPGENAESMMLKRFFLPRNALGDFRNRE